MNRNAYLLTTDFNSDRAIFSKKILEKVGFNVILFKAIKNENPLLSHKISVQNILQLMLDDSQSEWNYFFEDDINLLEDIKLDEIIQYENISDKFFYLGCCLYGNFIKDTNFHINNHKVYKVYDNVRGLHAIALNKQGSKDLLNLSLQFNNNNLDEYHTDVLLERYCRLNNANVIRLDLESPCVQGHRGIFFQDRNRHKNSYLVDFYK